ncbi:MAG: polysialyltransferase family glycosyltransferase [Lachnospiraceae bacterium]
MKNIYICNTYYHVLISIIKSIKYPLLNDLMIVKEPYDDTELNEEFLLRLNEKKIFNNIIIINFKKYYFHTRNLFTNICNRFKWINSISKIEFNKSSYENIYIYNDSTSFGKYLNDNKISYNLLEDGENCYKTIPGYKDSLFVNLSKKIFGLSLPKLATSNLINSIEVNDDKDLYINNKKITVKNKKKLYQTLTQEEIKLIIDIFIGKIDYKFINGTVLLLTQPLEECLNCSEKEKIAIYKKLIEENLNENEQLVIKPHPRETTNYSKYFSSAIVLQSSFPFEILSLSKQLTFNKALTIKSTAINCLNLGKNKKIEKGLEWAKKAKNSL